MSFSENLMRLRKQKGLSQGELANEIDVSRQTVSKWELGTTTPEMDKLVQLSSFFNVSVDELVNAEDITSKVNNASTTVETNINTETTNNNDKKNKKGITILVVTVITGLIITIITILIILLAKNFDNSKNNNTTDNKSTNTRSNVVENKIENEVENKIENNTSNVVNNKVEEKITSSKFNSEYHNGRTKGEYVEKDLSNVITNNKTNKNIIIEVKYDSRATSNPEEIAEIKKGLDLESYYEITLDYDAEGYICSYTIEAVQKNQKEKSNNAKTFNFYFYRGTKTGFHIGYDLERIITSNIDNSDKQIYVKYNDIESNEKSEIKSVKGKLGTYTNYNIEFEYDEDGYINKYIIEEE